MNNFETPLVESLEHRITWKAEKQAEDLLIGVKDAVTYAYMKALSAYNIPEEDARDHIVRRNVERCHRDIESALSRWIVGDIIKDVTDQLVPLAPQPEPEAEPDVPAADQVGPLKVGERVRVTRKAEDHENGWNNGWTGTMNQAIGQTGVVTNDDGEFGVNIKFDSVIGCNCYAWPRHVLERVIEEPAPAADEPRLFKPGERVQVTRAVESHSEGWPCCWVDQMDNAIGQVGVVKEDRGTDGVALVFDSNESISYWLYPRHVLLRVPAESQPS